MIINATTIKTHAKLLIILCLFACDGPDPNPEKKLLISYGEHNFSYDSKDRIIQHHWWLCESIKDLRPETDYFIDYTYKNNRISEASYYEVVDGGTIINERVLDYIYEDDLLIEVVRTDGNGGNKSSIMFHYKDSVLEEISYGDSDGERTIYVFEFQDGNIVKVVNSSNYAQQTSTYRIEYDDMRNPLSEIGLPYMDILMGNPDPYLTKNNKVRLQLYKDDPGTVITEKFWEYEFDEEGYPLSSTLYGMIDTNKIDYVIYDYRYGVNE